MSPRRRVQCIMGTLRLLSQALAMLQCTPNQGWVQCIIVTSIGDHQKCPPLSRRAVQPSNQRVTLCFQRSYTHRPLFYPPTLSVPQSAVLDLWCRPSRLGLGHDDQDQEVKSCAAVTVFGLPPCGSEKLRNFSELRGGKSSTPTLCTAFHSWLLISWHCDDTADVDHDAEMRGTESSNKDNDSYEAQVRRLNERDFPMADILGGHPERLRADAPYRIPAHLLETMETTLSGSRAPTPAYIPRPPLTTARSPTLEFRPPTPHEAYGPALQLQDTTLFARLSRAYTTSRLVLSWADSVASARNPAFLPDSRGPTPYPHDLRGPTPEVLQVWQIPHFDMPMAYLQCDFTPMTFATAQMHTRSPPGACATSSPSPPPAKRRCMDSDDDSDGEQDQDDRDSDQEKEDATLSCRFNRPNKSVPRRVQRLLDLAAEDEDEDPELDDEEEDQETQADKGRRGVLVGYCSLTCAVQIFWTIESRSMTQSSAFLTLLLCGMKPSMMTQSHWQLTTKRRRRQLTTVAGMMTSAETKYQ
ncbi:hypothetical protein K438DRAFT_1760074 [Mycena galopus ATCC 62051]|nr:hypothetical protein K438DRAFT_1760074 [Mycena galopus ATCC 62051]